MAVFPSWAGSCPVTPIKRVLRYEIAANVVKKLLLTCVTSSRPSSTHPPCSWGSIISYDWVLITIYCVVKVSERLSFVGKQIPCHRFTESATVGCWLYIHLLFPHPSRLAFIPPSVHPSPLKIAVVRALCCFWHSSDKTANRITLADSKSCQVLFEFWLEKGIYGGYW